MSIVFTISLNDKVSSKLKGVNSLADKLEGKVDAVNSELGETARKTSAAKRGFERLNKSVSGIGKALKAAFIIEGLASIGQAAISQGTEIINLAAQMEGINNAIRFASGAEGEKNLQFLTDLSKKYGLPAIETAEGFKVLAGAMMGTSLQGDQTRMIFEGVAQGVAVMGLTADDANGVFRALGQIMSKGKVSAEELNGQLGERLPGALGIAARAMNMSKAELMKLMAEGKLMAEDFLPAFGAEMQKTFGDQALKSSNSLRANLNRLQNSLQSLKLAAGAAAAPLVISFSQFATAVMGNLQPVKEAMKGLKQATEPLQATFAQMFGGGTTPEGFVNALAKMVEIAAPLASLFAKLQAAVWQGLQPAFQWLSNLFQAVWPSFLGVLDEVGKVVFEVGKVLKGVASELFSVLNIGGDLAIVFDAVKMVLSGVVQAVQFVGKIALPIFSGLVWVAGKLIPILTGVVKFLSLIVGALVQGLFTTLNKLFSGFDSVLEFLGIDTRINFRLPTQAPEQGANETNETQSTAASIFSEGSSTGAAPDGGPVAGAANPTAVASGISGGGSRPTNITINLDALVQQLSINTTNLQEGSQQIQNAVQDALLRVLNSANQVANG